MKKIKNSTPSTVWALENFFHQKPGFLAIFRPFCTPGEGGGPKTQNCHFSCFYTQINDIWSFKEKSMSVPKTTLNINIFGYHVPARNSLSESLFLG